MAGRARAARPWPPPRRSVACRCRGVRSHAVSAEHLGLVGELVAREHEEAARAEELTRAAGNDLGPPFAPIVGLGFLVLFVLEAGGRGALAQDDVERLFDVVGVQLLVEIDDVVVLVVGLLDDRGRDRYLDDRGGIVGNRGDDVVVDQARRRRGRRRRRRRPRRRRSGRRRDPRRRSPARRRTRRHSSRPSERVRQCVSRCGCKTRVNRALNRHVSGRIPASHRRWERGSITPGLATPRAPARAARFGRVQEAGGAAGWPGCSMQTGYRSVLYQASWTSALRPFAQPSGHDAPVASEAGSSITGSGAAGAMRSEPHHGVRVKPNDVALTCNDARRRRSRTHAKSSTFSRCSRAVARVVLTAARTAGH